MKKFLICLLALLVLTVLCACGNNTEGTTDFTLPLVQSTGTEAGVKGTTGTEGTEPTVATEETLPPDSSETANMRKARFSAEGYLAEMPFSREGLIGMLTKYENFTAAEASYGADNCGADWNEEAVRMAERYTASLPFSRVSLEAQLKHEGFTKAEASYGVLNAKVDWIKEAKELVEQQKEYMPSITDEALAKYLTTEKFTMAEIGSIFSENK